MKKLLFALLAASCALGIAISILRASREVRQLSASTSTPPSSTNPTSVDPVVTTGGPTTENPATSKTFQKTPGTASRHSPQSKAPVPLLYYSANKLGENYGKLAVARIDALNAPRYSEELRCERVHFSAGTGICLAADRGVFTSYYATKFDDSMRPGWTIKLNGTPSRVRVSRSGRLAAITVFLTGHSYASLNFSTQTTILDTAAGNVVADLDNLSVTRDHQEFKSPDFNFWGVTFASDENVFYATLWSKAKTYLIEGNLARRTARVIHEGVECPSLSPDNTRIAFKKRVEGNRLVWRITVLNLQDGSETVLGESRSVDDQVEWLDNRHVLYALSQGDATHSSASTNLWKLPTVKDGTPQLMLQGAFSPAVVPYANATGQSVASSGANRNPPAR